MNRMSGALHWTARLSGLLIAGFFAFLFLGEFLNPHSGPPANFREWSGIVLLMSACAGMLIAWRRELPGAVLSLGALAALIFLIPMQHYAVVAITAIPGLLYVLDWTVAHRHA